MSKSPRVGLYRDMGWFQHSPSPQPPSLWTPPSPGGNLPLPAPNVPAQHKPAAPPLPSTGPPLSARARTTSDGFNVTGNAKGGPSAEYDWSLGRLKNNTVGKAKKLGRLLG